MKSRFVALLAVAMSLSAGGCSTAQEADKNMLPSIHVAIGMSIDELRAGSTYPFGRDPSAGASGRIGSYEIATPYNLSYAVSAGRDVEFENIGGEHLRTFIVVIEGRVRNLTVVAQDDRMTLDAAIDRAREIADQFRAAGVIQGQSFAIQGMELGVPRPVVSTLEEARVVLANEDVVVSEMNLFSGETRDLRVSLNIQSGPRMLRLQNAGGAESPAEVAVREWRQGREWTLQLEIAPVLSPSPSPSP